MPSRLPAKITSKGQLTLPVKLRADLNLRAGETVVFVRSEGGRYFIEPPSATLLDLKGVIKAGDLITGDDVKDWIGQSRGRLPDGLRRQNVR